MTSTEPRHLVIVDLETSSLEPNTEMRGAIGWARPRGVHGVAVEAAWWDLSTGEMGSFVPQHDVDWVLRFGSPEALEVCRYRERLARAEQDDGTKARDLAARLTKNTLVGSSPHFDATFLRPLFQRHEVTDPEPWHHRLLDLSNVAATALGLPFSELPSLAKVCERLGVDLQDAHTAAGDVRATGECLVKLMEMTPQRQAAVPQ